MEPSRHAEASSRHSAMQGNPANSLKALLAYQSETAGRQTAALLGRIASRVSGPEVIEILPWSFDMVQNPNWTPNIQHDLEHADLLVVAAQGRMPFNVVQWAQSAIRRKSQTETAVVLIDLSPTESERLNGPAWRLLESAAFQARLECFASGSGDSSGPFESGSEGETS